MHPSTYPSTYPAAYQAVQAANQIAQVEFALTPDSLPIRLLLVEDQTIIRQSLRLLLQSQPGVSVVGEAGNTSEAVSVASREQPDIILLDLNLGRESGLDCLPELRSVAPEANVLILTGENDPQLHHEAVSLGAKGLIRKTGTPEALIEAIRKVYLGEVCFEGMLMARLLNEMWQMRAAKQAEAETSGSNHAVKPEPQTIQNGTVMTTESLAIEATKIALLTEREREIVILIGEGLKNKQIADRLFISEVTVRHHLSSIYSKLEVADRFELAIYAFRHRLAKLPL
jgi:DNA-binding NarL/FixJ family response regulator